jgi:hypothetical protein
MSTIVYEPSDTGHWKELFKSKNKLLGGHNLKKDEEICATIDHVGVEEVFEKETNSNKELVVLKFKGGKIPPMALNITNSETIALMHGNTHKKWVGKKILIHTAPIKAFGKMHDALRVRPKVPRDDDLTPYIKQLTNCQNMQDLQTIFLAMPKHIQGAVVATKDEMKAKL